MAEPLTRRQTEVLALIAAGLSTDDIAARLWISKATVRNHVQQILTRLDVHSRLAAVRAAGAPPIPVQRTVTLTLSNTADRW